MKTVKELISELEKVENKDMEVTIKTGYHIKSIDTIFECSADGVPFICIDEQKN